MHWEQYSAGAWVLAAGAAGAVIRVATAKELSRRQVVWFLIAGTAMSVCVTPAIVDLWFANASEAVQRGIAFVVGVAGPLVAGLTLKVIERRGERLIERAADRVIGSNDKEQG